MQAITSFQQQIDSGNIVDENKLSAQDKKDLKVGFTKEHANDPKLFAIGTAWLRYKIFLKRANTEPLREDKTQENIKFLQGRFLPTKWVLW